MCNACEKRDEDDVERAKSGESKQKVAENADFIKFTGFFCFLKLEQWNKKRRKISIFCVFNFEILSHRTYTMVLLETMKGSSRVFGGVGGKLFRLKCRINSIYETLVSKRMAGGRG